MTPPERWHIERIEPDGSRSPVLAGDHPWAGSKARAEVEALRLQRETGALHEAKLVVG